MMAEHDQNNDEYKFAELDSYDMDQAGESDLDSQASYQSGKEGLTKKKDIKRNALIAIGVVIFIMVMYKIIGWMFFSDKSKQVTSQPAIPPVTQVATPQPVQTIPTTPIQQVQPATVVEDDSDLKKKVSAIEMSQQSLRSEVNALSEQINAVNNNIKNLNAQIVNLNQIIGNMSNQIARQSEVINVLMVRTTPKKVVKISRPAVAARVIYYIQAVIPGRAWLIGSNGSTLTVREGSKIPGYGIVKLIDSLQGRILTSSGQVIKFSQEDS
ncbi:TPA: type IVB secretion system protein IcmG/DotF [Legionella pneumophila]|uniref:type IVB secretion system protein IcmG/DotF n=1 Tax=Legionella pneumophila TaxID=446 RepID=UPI0009B58C65|nr:type IVB secretion system protein IcmG/DotF [Legionella pneumophila]MDW8879563.1 type IVB secretion system protein IcmG/DotF [Legionella pneumophila subsp. fraseri]MDW8962668.1 type IVB secretion system protein IcmG/DotF [Legionella pneumophila subsp. fraseri]MDW9036663.1 type IVB secretion system protein IcmG/DotF [Legionella pneumophila subsp. fraseri]MDW9039867.1 type IVB secretion system protein IcmG/DotF [Legionella pneumophila subsp. fraseri]MDW9042857.1 type IVB secretion system prot